ncbi:MAG: patatin family protein, partial [Ruminiclostridium sp.]|nr:patatin family protein [Ruminiclostridium sp.]
GYESATPLVRAAYRRYPEFVQSFVTRPERYNQALKELEQLSAEGKALILTPKDIFGVGRTERGLEKLEKLYNEGYRCFKENEALIKAFINQ